MPPNQSITLDRLGTIKVLQAIKQKDEYKTDVGMKYGRTKYEVQAAGIATSLTGALVIVCRGDIGVLAHFAFNLGDIMILAALVFYALYTALLRVRPIGVPDRRGACWFVVEQRSGIVHRALVVPPMLSTKQLQWRRGEAVGLAGSFTTRLAVAGGRSSANWSRAVLPWMAEKLPAS